MSANEINEEIDHPHRRVFGALAMAASSRSSARLILRTRRQNRQRCPRSSQGPHASAEQSASGDGIPRRIGPWILQHLDPATIHDPAVRHGAGATA